MVEFAVRGGDFPRFAKYEIREEIGHGGMATVYRALDSRLGREVALKVIHPHLRNSAEVAARFHTEAQAVAKLHHPNIVEVFDVAGSDEPEQYLVVELVHGTTLRRVLQESGAMPAEIAASVAVTLLDALAHAHASGVIHRDLKPENVLIEHRKQSGTAEERGDAGPRANVKLTDFGIAKLLDAQGVTSTGQVLGSPAHMAPEQIEGGEVDGRSDIFGVGVLLYECMVGHLPFEGSNPAQVLRRVLDGIYRPARVEQPRVGDHWSGIVDRALAHARTDRFADAQAMRDALVAELDGLGCWPADRELEVYLDDPETYTTRHTARIVARLCERAELARRQGRTLAAASDYNRALANAPDDPRLLRIVARLHAVEVRKRLFRRWGKIAAVAAAGGIVAGGVARSLHTRLARPMDISDRGELRSSDGATPRPAGASAVATSPEPATSATAAALPRVVVAKPVDRRLTLDLIPPMGVSVSVDRQPPRSVSTGDTLTLDSRAHALTFSCSVCVATQVAVSASEHDDTLVVSVPVKPAILVIEGEVDRTYQVVEHPEVVARAGTTTIPLKSAFEHVTIKQIETGASVSLRLEAGKSVRAQFP
ncbi:MAG TPA: protein kinase [Polyangiaceae bacterium]|nr:protein kinase [Polyangiaceae bacterium]